MKKYRGIVVVFAVIGASSAIAADMAVKAPQLAAPVAYNWTGFYLGAMVGGSWGDIDQRWPATDHIAVAGTTASFSPSGFVFGGKLGARYQWNQVVLGIEAGALTGITWRDDVVLPGPGISPYSDITQIGLRQTIRHLETVTGQLGYAWDRWLVYAKGGWARASVNSWAGLTSTDGDAGQSPFNCVWQCGQVAAFHHGWTAGGGVDYVLNRTDFVDLIVGIDYNYVHLNDAVHHTSPTLGVSPSNPENFTTIVGGNVQSVMVNLTLKFNPPRM
jgi:outer membrane immunogenic protein